MCTASTWPGPNGGAVPTGRRRSCSATATPAPPTTSPSQVDALAADRRVRHPRPAGPRPLDQDGPPRRLHHRAALGRPRGLHRCGGRWAGRPARPLHGRAGGDGPGAGPARPGALADPHGHERLVLPPTRPGDPRHGARVHATRSTRPAACPATFSMGGPEDALIEARHAGEWRSREGRHLRRHGPLRRQGAGRRADGRRRRRRHLAAGQAPVHRLPDDRHRRRARPSAGRPGARPGRRGGGRPADRHCGGLPLAPADACGRVAGRGRGPSGRGRSPRGRNDRRPATQPRIASSWPAPMSPSRPSGSAPGPGATRARGAWAATTSP